nr:reverse transcriptase domain-containing protein [Tanacetum cinerariifolium]
MRSFLKTERALIDVYEGELTLRVGNKGITFNLDQTTRYSANYDAIFMDFPDFLLEETNAFLAIDDEPISSKIDNSYYDSKGDILLLEEFLNDDPSSPPLPPQELKGNDNLPVIIAKDLKDDEKTALIKILMEDDFKLTVLHQRRVNPKIHEMVKKEVLKLLDARLIYPISDSPWVSPVHCVPKKTPKIKKTPQSRVLMEHLPTVTCLSAYVINRARSKGV